ncbi:MAG: tRNA (guanosine(46)-N7)-methyltransferase TrmB [Verrucomicrobiales bacterium]|jgi:tRNA (guanine-N7-)-methyltransferase|nr:tRNA (guanosine(46)-N7)-methyltransferase TrmB [Verrucomicrobiales bacterium]
MDAIPLSALPSPAAPAFDPWLPNDDLLRVFDWRAIFCNASPVEIELGAGDGGFILEYAARHRQRNFVAVERLKGRVGKIAKRAAQRGLANLRALRLQSEYVIGRMCPPASVSVIHIMFPDPWPKRRHFKHRLIQPAFLAALSRALADGGTARFTTDHAEYFQWTQKIWSAAAGWKNLGAWDADADPKSDFQRQFESEGKPSHRCQWQKI